MRLTTSGLEVKQSQLIGYSSYAGIGTNGLAVAGNVGIGTSSPTAKLHLYSALGTAQITQDAGTAFRIISNNGINYIQSGTALSSDSKAPLVFSSMFGVTEQMRLDSSGNLGIGTSSPGEKLQVAGAIRATGAVSANTTGGILAYQGSSTVMLGSWGADASTYGAIQFYQANSTGTINRTGMLLDSSGNLGLGVTPSAWATYKATQVGWSALAGYAAADTAVFSNAFFDGGYKYIGNGFASQYRQINSAHQWYTAPSGTAGNAISFTQAMTLDASANLTVTPGGGSGLAATQTGLNVFGGTSSGAATSAGVLTLGANASTVVNGEVLGRVQFYSNDASGSSTGVVGKIDCVATSTFVGDCETALTFHTNDGVAGTVAERARITSGGNLLVGTTSALKSGKVSVNASGTNGITCQVDDVINPAFQAWSATTAGNALFIDFSTEGGAGTSRGSISYNRAGGLVAYNTTSDYRAKDIIGPVQNVGATIDALKVYEGQMKGATQSRPMLVAHEAQEHAPYAVSGVKDEVNEDGSPKFQQMDVSSLVPLLLAEIQSLRARVAALESN
jgi:hypothetical protein